MNNPLLLTLEIVQCLDTCPHTVPALCKRYDLAPATVKRYIAEARLLGADIVSARIDGSWVYGLRNWPAIKERTLRWIELEKSRSLL